MRGPLILLAGLIASTVAAAMAIAQAPAPNQAQLAEGETVFAGSCGNQYCHGAGGRGAQGPALAGVPMTPEHIRETILEGRSGTQMASFREVLEPRQLDAVTAYVLSISSGGRLTMPAPGDPALAARPSAFPPIPPPPALSTVPVAIGGGMGTPAAGLAPFFDPTTVQSCRSCHSFSKRGGPLGVDLAVAGKTAPEVLVTLTHPRVAARAYPVVTVTLSDGTRLTGIRARESADTLSVYDLAMPPVRRTFAKSAIAEVTPGKQGLFDHTRLHYTRQQLRDMAAMIGSGAAPGPQPGPPRAGTAARAYVTNELSGDLTVIDLATGQTVATVPLGKRPRGIKPSPDGRLLYIALSGSPVSGPGVDESKLPPPDKGADGIGVFDVAHLRLVKILRGVSDPENLAVNARGDRLYVASEDTGQLVVMAARSGAILSRIAVGAEPEEFGITPDGALALVTSETGNSVAIVETASGRLRAAVKVGERPRNVLFAHGKAFIPGESDGSITAIDPATGKLIWRLVIAGTLARPMGMAAAGAAIFATTGRGGELVRIDPTLGKVTGRVHVGDRPWGAAATPDGRYIVTADGPSNDAALVDAATMEVIARYPAGTRPWGVAALSTAPTGQRR